MSAEADKHPDDANNEHDRDAGRALQEPAIEQTEPEPYERPYDQSDLCDNNPEFPVICSFIAKFGESIVLRLNIEDLRRSIEDQESLDDSLIDLHVKLLKKLRRYFNRDQWERALIRFTYEYSFEDGYELECLGYLKTRPSIKLELLRRLLDAQFECDPKFKTIVNSLDADELRNQPTGRDIKGNTYWHCADNDGNLRIYRDEPENYKAWKTVCRNSEDLKSLLNELEKSKSDKVKGESQTEAYNPYPDIFPELFAKKESPIIAELDCNKISSKRPAKKGRGRAKKSSPSNTLDEVDENAVQEEHPSRFNPINTDVSIAKETRPQSISPTGSTSVESQVKYTIENILSKVSSSFDFIFRRSSPDTIKESHLNEEIVEKKPVKPKGKSKKLQSEQLPRRTSSRIQQLQQKKVSEQEENSKNQVLQAKLELNAKLDDANSRDLNIPDKKSKSPHKKDKQRWRNNKGKKKLSWDKDDSDLSSTSSLTESNDESFIQAIDDNEQNDNNDDDEFACEDEETNGEPVVVKKARTARQSTGAAEMSDPNNISLVDEDKPCGRCDGSHDPECILLCDMCDDGYHTTCCIPPLMYVPDGDWFCPSCEHKVLIEKLTQILSTVEALLDTKERERAKKQRLRQAKNETTKAKSGEISSGARRDNFINELGEPLAVQAIDDELGASPDDALSPSYRERAYRRPKKKVKKTKKVKQVGRRSNRWSDSDEDDYWQKRKSKKTYSRHISESESEGENFTGSSEAPEESDDSDKPKTRKARACVSYKFNEYDELIQSAICADSDMLDAGLTDHEDEDEDTSPCNLGRGKDMATIEALAYQQENGIADMDAPLTGEVAEANEDRRANSCKKRGRKLNDLDAESDIDIATSDESFQASSATEEDDEDEDSGEATEVTSDDESSIDEIVAIGHRSRGKKSKKKKRAYTPSSEDSEFAPRSRRAAAKHVSYRETTDDEDEIIKSTNSVKKSTLSSGDETDASWKSPANSCDDIQESTSVEPEKSVPSGEGPSLIQPSPDPETVSEKTASETVTIDPQTEKAVVPSPAKPKKEEKVNKKIRLEKRETRPVFVPSATNDPPISQPIYPQPSQLTYIQPQYIQPQYGHPQYSHPQYFSPSQRPFYPQPPPYGPPPPNALPYMVRPPPMSGSLISAPMIRDPMNDLNQYCTRSPYPANIFNSFNMSLPPKNMAPPRPHPPFYAEDEVRPPPSNPSGKQRSW